MAIVNVSCSKCDGKGKLWFYSHRDQGICYACKGAGVVSAEAVTERQRAKFQAGMDAYNLVEVGDEILNVNPRWALHIIERCAREMIVVNDTEWARKTLATLPPRIRGSPIEKGRELKAA